MDRFSSRFRAASRRASPSGARESSPSLSTADGRLAPPSRHDTPPVLSISTTPTSPRPGSSHSNTSSTSNSALYTPRSPFQSLRHFRSAHKRARSPAPASFPAATSPALANHDGTVEHDMMSPAKDQPTNGNGNGAHPPVEKPKVPNFLTVSEQVITLKFQDLTWQERIRQTRPEFVRLDDPEAKLLDRYMNIFPWADNRIHLQVPEDRLDYINASPIILQSPLKPNDRSPHRYIAMQGPKFESLEHAWRMVVEQLQGPAVIVMLTETHEMGAEKCYPYFPRSVESEVLEIGEDDEFGDGFRAQVTCASIEERANGAIEMRKLNVHVEGREEDMTVWHLLYRKWPDFGVPAIEDIDSFFELMHLSRELNASEDNPRIVHCSAGVGRSGTFIALEHLMREIDSGDLEYYKETPDKPDYPSCDLVFHTVNELRKQRIHMVQAEGQYLFIYQVLRKRWIEKYGVVDDPGDEPAAKRLEVDHDPFH
ncbi:Uu.00g144310.m01.CDS01 [Anthostomella pinea]|uniref:Uu.00g144310.m01.CDS01 n=1 Tax=Anthostomella pinea TaxID=933095 RepID=A0AAI8VQV8_9PEZI|nr:Uu.00g144310.m01.CDS01 [Anthostomella pinea]